MLFELHKLPPMAAMTARKHFCMNMSTNKEHEDLHMFIFSQRRSYLKTFEIALQNQ